MQYSFCWRRQNFLDKMRKVFNLTLLFLYLHISCKFRNKMILQEFNFGNFRSFKEINTLNMAAAKIQSKNPNLDVKNLIETHEGLSFLKSKAIYGANASGKSNVILALSAFINIVQNSVKDNLALVNVDNFELFKNSQNLPSFFQMIFTHDDVRYRYGFEIENFSIASEWLFARINAREIPLFTREKFTISNVSKKHFAEVNLFLNLLGDDVKGNEIFRDDSLLLSSLASFGFGKLSKRIVEAISSIQVTSDSGSYGRFTNVMEAIKDSDAKSFILKFLQSADFAIEDLVTMEWGYDNKTGEIINPEQGYSKHHQVKRQLVSKRPVYNDKFEKVGDADFFMSSQESDGTKKMVELSPYIYQVFKSGGILVIDEFDAKLHPLLTKRIVDLFNSAENKNAQLIFTTHDTNLLSYDILRRDQIDFVEKDKYGASHLYTLVEFKGVRNSASFEKDYIQGKYGAIPFLGNFDRIFTKISDAQED